jgi:hypothetical protein
VSDFWVKDNFFFKFYFEGNKNKRISASSSLLFFVIKNFHQNNKLNQLVISFKLRFIYYLFNFFLINELMKNFHSLVCFYDNNFYVFKLMILF